jgi:predicted ABC-type ATPase
MAAPYKLSSDVSEQVYEAIFDTYARNRASLKFPRLAIIGAQPGSGKSSVSGIITDGFGKDASPVVANIDDLRNFHPAAKEIFQRHPFEMAVYTNEDAWLWTDKLLNDARRAKNNALYESTIRVANPVEVIIKTFQREGYAVDLHALAVNSKLSIQGIYDRFENQLDFSSAPRWTGIEFHDAAYVAFPANVGYLEASAGLERVTVYRRNGASLYLNAQTVTQPAGAEQAIITERNREWEVEAKQEYLDKWNQLCVDIATRDGIKPEWYVENAQRLRQEAELFTASRPAHSGERIIRSRIMSVTHHHVFMHGKQESELVCFDITALDAAKLPKRNLRLVSQPQDSQPR